MKQGSAPLATREMHTKTPVSYHYIPIKRAKIKNSDNLKC